jgi:hypothetical protein
VRNSLHHQCSFVGCKNVRLRHHQSLPDGGASRKPVSCPA